MLPAILCACACAIGLLGTVRKGGPWQVAFYAFLPAAFIYMAGLLLQLNRELSRLRRRVGRLEMRPGATPDKPAEGSEVGQARDVVERG